MTLRHIRHVLLSLSHVCKHSLQKVWLQDVVSGSEDVVADGTRSYLGRELVCDVDCTSEDCFAAVACWLDYGEQGLELCYEIFGVGWKRIGSVRWLLL